MIINTVHFFLSLHFLGSLSTGRCSMSIALRPFSVCFSALFDESVWSRWRSVIPSSLGGYASMDRICVSVLDNREAWRPRLIGPWEDDDGWEGSPGDTALAMISGLRPWFFYTVIGFQPLCIERWVQHSKRPPIIIRTTEKKAARKNWCRCVVSGGRVGCS